LFWRICLLSKSRKPAMPCVKD